MIQGPNAQSFWAVLETDWDNWADLRSLDEHMLVRNLHNYLTDIFNHSGPNPNEWDAFYREDPGYFGAPEGLQGIPCDLWFEIAPPRNASDQKLSDYQHKLLLGR